MSTPLNSQTIYIEQDEHLILRKCPYNSSRNTFWADNGFIYDIKPENTIDNDLIIKVCLPKGTKLLRNDSPADYASSYYRFEMPDFIYKPNTDNLVTSYFIDQGMLSYEPQTMGILVDISIFDTVSWTTNEPIKETSKIKSRFIDL